MNIWMHFHKSIFFTWIFLINNNTLIEAIDLLKVLVIELMPTRSHHILSKEVSSILAERGHNVTFFSPFESTNSKFLDMPIEELQSLHNESIISINSIDDSFVKTISTLSEWIPSIVTVFLESKKFRKTYDDTSERFDVIILEYFSNEALLGLGVRYNCPIILLSPLAMPSPLARMINNPTSMEIVPNLFSRFTANMNIWERTINLVMSIGQSIVQRIFFELKQRSLYQKYFPLEAAKVPFDGLTNYVSGAIINSHPSIGVSRPFLQNVVEVAGFHITNNKTLPKDLQNIIDDGKNGVIYFSMGSNVKSSQMKPAIINQIKEALGSLNQTVLWKFEENLDSIHKNIIVNKWMPQSSILAHPNVKIFITHGGLLSCIEAIHFGKPVIVIPIFGDQYHNAQTIKEHGNGLVINYKNLTKQSLLWAVEEILTQKKYTAAAERLNKRFLDRPLSPKRSLIFHVEYIVRNQGAFHLKPLNFPFLSGIFIDLSGLLLSTIILGFIILIPLRLFIKFCISNTTC